MSFIRVVKNYEKIGRLGQQIINHKDLVRRTSPEKWDEEFRKQENRIQEFVEITNKAHKEWEKNPYLINEYWWGLS